MKRLHFIRHGLSEANLSTSVNRRKPDHAIELTEWGFDQAKIAGAEMVRHLLQRTDHYHGIRFLVSPYRRTRDTAAQVMDEFDKTGIAYEARECLQLREQSFGLFDGLTPEELTKAYPNEYEHYLKHRTFEGEFFAPMPSGESRARVCDRVRGVFGSILRDFSSQAGEQISDIICVSHGVTIRCAIMEFLHLPWEWCEKEPNPGNCSITTISGAEDRGWQIDRIFDGFSHPHASSHALQEHRELGHAA